MSIVPKSYFRPNGFFAHTIGLPAFVFGFLMLFFPASKAFHINQAQNFAEYSFSDYSFDITMISCIILVVMLITRIVMLVLSDKNTFTWKQAYLCILAEIVFSNGFSALYLWLMSNNAEAYIWFFGQSLVTIAILMLIPYIIINLYFVGVEKDERLHQAQNGSTKEKIKFLDERGNVKLMVAAEAILYVQSDENYLKICYLEDNNLSFYTLRNSMKRIEELCVKNGLVRCHRSYFVNKMHIKVLQKDKEFTYAVLDVPNAAHIPVSKNYIDQMTAIL
ncbi:MAG: LytTR family transcriptional regulator [Bacteroidales bacterium]|nr:LytTR family transcriptional regulator [Bacteroidales bacterium]